MKLTKRLIPSKIYNLLVEYKDNQKFKFLKSKILKYYKQNPPHPSDIGKINALNYLEKNPVTYFPYDFISNYNRSDFQVFMDEERQMYYVLHEGNHKLYFKKKFTEEDVRDYYNFLKIEQDNESSHRYFNSKFNIQTGDVVADVGAAEGNFSLASLINGADFVYLFEPDDEWIEPLMATFEPWKDSIEIIHKFASDKDDDENITIDTYFSQNKKNPDVLKVDVEGMEEQVLSGAKNTLNNKHLKIALCTYHKHNDDVKYPKLFEQMGFSIHVSENYMLVINDKLKPPFFRKGVVHACMKVSTSK